jgi:prepilin-type N-terminal cleavage/methylation domain-containing protein
MSRAALQTPSNRLRMARNGFTLLELLVSMTVVSLLATTVLFSWRIAAGAWGKANQLVEELRRAAATQQLLETQMAEMVPTAHWQRKGMGDVFFQGERQTARFLSRYSLANRARSGLYRIEYQIVTTSDGTQQLLMNEVPERNSDASGLLLTGAEQKPEGTVLRFAPFERRPETRVLLDGLREAHFEYYRLAGPLGAAGWVSDWTSLGSQLPRAMAIRVTPGPDDAARRTVSVVAGIENYALIPPGIARR